MRIPSIASLIAILLIPGSIALIDQPEAQAIPHTTLQQSIETMHGHQLPRRGLPGRREGGGTR